MKNTPSRLLFLMSICVTPAAFAERAWVFDPEVIVARPHPGLPLGWLAVAMVLIPVAVTGFLLPHALRRMHNAGRRRIPETLRSARHESAHLP